MALVAVEMRVTVEQVAAGFRACLAVRGWEEESCSAEGLTADAAVREVFVMADQVVLDALEASGELRDGGLSGS